MVIVSAMNVRVEHFLYKFLSSSHGFHVGGRDQNSFLQAVLVLFLSYGMYNSFNIFNDFEKNIYVFCICVLCPIKLSVSWFVLCCLGWTEHFIVKINYSVSWFFKCCLGWTEHFIVKINLSVSLFFLCCLIRLDITLHSQDKRGAESKNCLHGLQVLLNL